MTPDLTILDKAVQLVDTLWLHHRIAAEMSFELHTAEVTDGKVRAFVYRNHFTLEPCVDLVVDQERRAETTLPNRVAVNKLAEAFAEWSNH